MYDIIVVGGGIVGATAAYLLAKNGKKILLIDENKNAQSTKAAAGIICPWLSKRRNKIWYQLAKNGAKYYPEFIQQLEQETAMKTGYQRNGTICLRDSTEKIKALFELAKERRLEAPEMGEIFLLSQEEMLERLPLLNATDYQGLFVSGGAKVEGSYLIAALRAGAQQFGADLVDGTAAFRDSRSVTVNGVTYQAEQFFLAAGAWLPNLMEGLHLNAAIIPQKGQLLKFQLQQETDHWPVVLPPASKSIVPFSAGSFIVGATHENGKGFDCEGTTAGYQEIISEMTPFLPEISTYPEPEVLVGTRPYTSDFTPFIGSLEKYPHIFTVNGLGSSGLTTGPYLASVAVNLLLKQPIELDLTLYDPNRYLSEL